MRCGQKRPGSHVCPTAATVRSSGVADAQPGQIRESTQLSTAVSGRGAAVVAVTVPVRPHSRFKWPNAGEAALPGVWITHWRGGPR
jgi:hypothetical protein